MHGFLFPLIERSPRLLYLSQQLIVLCDFSWGRGIAREQIVFQRRNAVLCRLIEGKCPESTFVPENTDYCSANSSKRVCTKFIVPGLESIRRSHQRKIPLFYQFSQVSRVCGKSSGHVQHEWEMPDNQLMASMCITIFCRQNTTSFFLGRHTTIHRNISFECSDPIYYFIGSLQRSPPRVIVFPAGSIECTSHCVNGEMLPLCGRSARDFWRLTRGEKCVSWFSMAPTIEEYRVFLNRADERADALRSAQGVTPLLSELHTTMNEFQLPLSENETIEGAAVHAIDILEARMGWYRQEIARLLPQKVFDICDDLERRLPEIDEYTIAILRAVLQKFQLSKAS